MSLPDALELAASELSQHADAVRDANGDPDRLLETLSAGAASEVLSWLLSNETRAGEELALAWSESARGARPPGCGRARDLLGRSDAACVARHPEHFGAHRRKLGSGGRDLCSRAGGTTDG